MVALEGAIKIQGADASTVPTEHEHTVTMTGSITDSDAISNEVAYFPRTFHGPVRLGPASNSVSAQICPFFLNESVFIS